MEKQSITNTSPSSSYSSSQSSWIRGSCVGRGCFGTVSKAVSKIDGGVFAVKSVDLATCLPAQAESLENEIFILRSIKSHPYIVKFLGDDVSKEGMTSFRNLHLEYLPEGDVANRGIINETLLRRYVWCLVSALSHAHSNGIVHCDVKSKNVLVFNGGSSVKLADFGSAVEFEKSTVQVTPRGSPLWMAPEVIRREYQGPESDVWSLGCTLIEMLTGKPAWEDGLDSLSRIGYSNELPLIPAGISELERDFLEKCLKRDRSQRWSCDQLLEHPFLLQDHHDSFLTESSPRCVLDWVNSEFDEEEESNESSLESMVSATARIRKLALTGGATWESNGWVEVRGRPGHASEKSEVKPEYLVSTRVESELNTPPPESEESASELTREVILLLILVVEIIQIYATFYITSIILSRILYCCYHYQNNNNNNNKKNKFAKSTHLSFSALTFCLVLHVIRIGLSIIIKLSTVTSLFLMITLI